MTKTIKLRITQLIFDFDYLVYDYLWGSKYNNKTKVVSKRINI